MAALIAQGQVEEHRSPQTREPPTYPGKTGGELAPEVAHQEATPMDIGRDLHEEDPESVQAMDEASQQRASEQCRWELGDHVWVTPPPK